MTDAALRADVADYYSSKLASHGPTPRGVDWNGAEGQTLRFQQLCRLIDRPEPFSIADVGCGYGALFDELAARHEEFRYIGLDISGTMIQAARARLAHEARAQWLCATRPPEPVDYAVASGIFNVRLAYSSAQWESHVEASLDAMHEVSQHGFAFNCLTSYSDAEHMRDDLYYADPCRLFDRCKRRYSRQVALLHDYGLYEFTIIVRKSP